MMITIIGSFEYFHTLPMLRFHPVVRTGREHTALIVARQFPRNHPNRLLIPNYSLLLLFK